MNSTFGRERGAAYPTVDAATVPTAAPRKSRRVTFAGMQRTLDNVHCPVNSTPRDAQHVLPQPVRQYADRASAQSRTTPMPPGPAALPSHCPSPGTHVMTEGMSFLHQALIFLAAAVVSVPLFKRLGLGSVLGYLAAGMVIGPFGIRAISDVESILHFAEFGVVLLLFLIGLELQPARLWELRKSVFGLGGLQVIGSGALVAGAGMAL